MFKIFIRILAFVAGVLLILDGGLPSSAHEMQIDGHSSNTRVGPNRVLASRDTDYVVNFIGGKTSSCSVGYAAYSKLNDGDTVTVKSSRIFNACLDIQRGDEEIYEYRYRKLFCLIGGALLLAAAFGWTGTNDDEDRPGITIRF